MTTYSDAMSDDWARRQRRRLRTITRLKRTYYRHLVGYLALPF
jgi:hypothetical protein